MCAHCPAERDFSSVFLLLRHTEKLPNFLILHLEFNGEDAFSDLEDDCHVEDG